MESFGSHLGGVGIPLGVAGVALGLILGVLSVLWAVQGLLWGVILRVWGTPGRVLRAVVVKDRGSQLRPLHFNRFWPPIGAQKGSKIELKSMETRFKNRLKIWLGF